MRSVGNCCPAAIATAGTAPMNGPNIGMSSAMPAKTPRTSAYGVRAASVEREVQRDDDDEGGVDDERRRAERDRRELRRERDPVRPQAAKRGDHLGRERERPDRDGDV